MKFPRLEEQKSSRDFIDSFRGYNHNLRISDNEFYDMKNLTSTHYPILSPRGKRGVYGSPDNPKKPINPQGLIAKDALCYVDGSTFWINKKGYDLQLSSTSYETVELVSMGAYVIIITRDAKGNPVDKKYFNTLEHSDFGNIEASYPVPEGVSVTYEMCKINGDSYTEKDESGNHKDINQSPNAPDNPENMDLWIDISSTPHVLKQYSKTSEMWVQIPTTYIKISAPNIASAFKQYDAVKITGFPSDVSQLAELEGNTFPLWEAYHDKGDENTGRAEGTEDYIVIIGILDKVCTKDTKLILERTMPNMDFIVESGNRLWGCHYGVATNGEVVNEIYASKLGDFKNWNCFMGISTDSYVASVGSDGVFTGAITHLGYPIFFKENYLHKVYGNYPSNYQVQTTACRGVQKGSEKSLAIVNEVLYYKSRNAVCAYDGSLPVEISSAMGDVSYFDAVAGSHGNKYYISMKDNADQWSLFVYDTAKGMWHKEDDLHAKAFCSCRNELYYLYYLPNGDTSTSIGTIFGSGTKDEDPVEWMAETGTLGIYTPDKKYVSRLNVRMSLDIGTRVHFYAQYDSSGEWEHLFTMNGVNLRSFSVPIRPKRCDHMKIRIVGNGDAKIYSIAKTIEQGSDI